LSYSFAPVLILTAATSYGCSIRKMALDSIGSAVAEAGTTYSSDDDPDLVFDAAPFGLKTIESLLEEMPRHKALLQAAARGFVQYGFARLQQEADFVEESDLSRATALRDRARRHYKRALEYGLRGLEVDFPGLRARLRADPAAALARTAKRHVPLLYWTSLAWGGAISISKDDSELTADQYVVEAMMKRALALDEGYEHGAGHDFFIAYDGGRPASAGGSVERARTHLERAVALSNGHRAWPLVTFAETVSVSLQERREFERLLRQALAIDADAAPALRVTNLLAQRRARWLLSRAGELFLEAPSSSPSPSPSPSPSSREDE
jgi:predicted anti-sigma-YlaC factor YlaD